MNNNLEESIRKKFNPDWYVPNFKVNYWKKKNFEYCVIIPVINEGERLKIFLGSIFKYKINEIADVIIVDGNSCDNSINIKLFKEYGVNGILTKKDIY